MSGFLLTKNMLGVNHPNNRRSTGGSSPQKNPQALNPKRPGTNTYPRRPGATTSRGMMRGSTLLLHLLLKGSHSLQSSSEAPFACCGPPTSHHVIGSLLSLTGYSSSSSLEHICCFYGGSIAELGQRCKCFLQYFWGLASGRSTTSSSPSRSGSKLYPSKKDLRNHSLF